MKGIIYVIKHVSFQLCRAYPDGVIYKIDGKYINKGVQTFIY